MAHRASKSTDPDSLAWTILQGRLDFDAQPDEAPAEDVVHIAPVLVMPSRDIALFTSLVPPQGQGPSSFLGSILIHALAASIVWFSLIYKPPVTRVAEEHYTVRQIDLHTPEQNARAAAHIPYPKMHPRKSANAGHAQQAAPPPRPVTKAQRGPQTLIQADLAKPVTLPVHIPVPQVVIWSPSKTTAKKIVPPLPEKPTSADVPPVLERPNQELTLADVNIASSNLPLTNSRIAPSTTSPVTIHQPQEVQLPPATASQQAAPPTPAAILSLSDLRLKDGTATLPPVNESQESKTPGALGSGQAENPSAQAGKGGPATKPGNNGSSKNAAATANHAGPSPAAGKPQTASAVTAPEIAANTPGRMTSTPIALPKDGHFGSVVTGEALDEQFPEMEGVWNGRIAYTAYLHVGLAKSWIMQYSLPSDTEAAAGGTVSRLEAPWPYNIVRPNLAPGSIDADALLVRGFVNESGRFEDLSIVFPQPFASAQFVLTALQQWQFRPATQDGQAVRVEVLLIIPEVLE